MDHKSKEKEILLNRLAYFFKHFRPEQKKEMEKPVKEFLAEPATKALSSKSLAKILDYLTKKVFKPMGHFGRPVPLNKQSPQTLKRRRDRWKPTFLLLNASPKTVQRRYYRSLTPKRRLPKKRSISETSENER